MKSKRIPALMTALAITIIAALTACGSDGASPPPVEAMAEPPIHVQAILQATHFISASHAYASPGEYVDIAINLDINPGITMLWLEISYDATALERVEVTPGTVLTLPVPPPPGANPFKLNLEAAGVFDIIDDTGSLAVVRFRVRDDAADCTAPIMLEVTSAYVAEGLQFDEVGVAVTHGSVNIGR